MSIELTKKQREAVLDGQAVRIALDDGEQPIILLREDIYRLLKEDQEDRHEQAAFLNASHQSAVSWMKDNPF